MDPLPVSQADQVSSFWKDNNKEAFSASVQLRACASMFACVCVCVCVWVTLCGSL